MFKVSFGALLLVEIWESDTPLGNRILALPWVPVNVFLNIRVTVVGHDFVAGHIGKT